MAKEEGQLVGEQFRKDWARFKRYVSGMMKAVIPGGKNTPEGPVFADLRTGGNRLVLQPSTQEFVRISGTSDATLGTYLQGSYSGYLQVTSGLGAGTTGANLALTKVATTQQNAIGLTDGELVGVKNYFEATSSISDTNTAHVLAIGALVPVALITPVPVSVGTSTCRLVFVYAGISITLAC